MHEMTINARRISGVCHNDETKTKQYNHIAEAVMIPVEVHWGAGAGRSEEELRVLHLGMRHVHTRKVCSRIIISDSIAGNRPLEQITDCGEWQKTLKINHDDIATVGDRSHVPDLAPLCRGSAAN